MKKLLLLLLLFSSFLSYSQITLRYFNAEWNSANGVNWCNNKKLSDCEIKYYDIGKDAKAATKYKIAVVPTIIIFKDGEEVARFQADLSFKMVATREEVQEEIDEQLADDY
jgi:hypothetical protein|tara:strand:- start:125 stop:457 length:333 start_codon:yes stop_codon:yes gene_type:complete